MMKKVFLLFFFIFSLCQWTISTAKSIDKIIFFGDSLSDNGNLYQSFFKIIPKSPPYFQGRFSNGPTWAELVGNYYYHQQYIDYHIYAVGGATAILHAPASNFIAPTNLMLEVNQYFLDSTFQNKSNTLYVIWIGANDYLFDKKTDPKKLTKAVIDQISWAVTTLIARGANHFLLLNLPDLSYIPFAKQNNIVERLSVLSQLHNQQFKDMIVKIKTSYPKINLTSIDVYHIFNEVINNPDPYNKKYHIHITDVTTSCWEGKIYIDAPSMSPSLNEMIQNNVMNQYGHSAQDNRVSQFLASSPSLQTTYQTMRWYDQGIVPCSNADEHLFWDPMHPTRIVHQVLAEIAIERLTKDL